MLKARTVMPALRPREYLQARRAGFGAHCIGLATDPRISRTGQDRERADRRYGADPEMPLSPGCLAPSFLLCLFHNFVPDHLYCNDIPSDAYQSPPERSARFRVWWRRRPFLIVARAIDSLPPIRWYLDACRHKALGDTDAVLLNKAVRGSTCDLILGVNRHCWSDSAMPMLQKAEQPSTRSRNRVRRATSGLVH